MDINSNGYSVGSTTLVDLQLAYQVTEALELTVGAENLFDEYPDKTPNPGGVGQLYPKTAHSASTAVAGTSRAVTTSKEVEHLKRNPPYGGFFLSRVSRD